jgi:hypothetical protein
MQLTVWIYCEADYLAAFDLLLKAIIAQFDPQMSVHEALARLLSLELHRRMPCSAASVKQAGTECLHTGSAMTRALLLLLPLLLLLLPTAGADISGL